MKLTIIHVYNATLFGCQSYLSLIIRIHHKNIIYGLKISKPGSNWHISNNSYLVLRYILYVNLKFFYVDNDDIDQE